MDQIAHYLVTKGLLALLLLIKGLTEIPLYGPLFNTLAQFQHITNESGYMITNTINNDWPNLPPNVLSIL